MLQYYTRLQHFILLKYTHIIKSYKYDKFILLNLSTYTYMSRKVLSKNSNHKQGTYKSSVEFSVSNIGSIAH